MHCADARAGGVYVLPREARDVDPRNREIDRALFLSLSLYLRSSPSLTLFLLLSCSIVRRRARLAERIGAFARPVHFPRAPSVFGCARHARDAADSPRKRIARDRIGRSTRAEARARKAVFTRTRVAREREAGGPIREDRGCANCEIRARTFSRESA